MEPEALCRQSLREGRREGGWEGGRVQAREEATLLAGLRVICAGHGVGGEEEGGLSAHVPKDAAKFPDFRKALS